MIEDMTVRGFNEHTRRDYVRHVRSFAAFIGRSPDMATAEDLRLFQLHQTRIGMQPPSINGSVSALRFFFTVTLDRPDLARRLTVVPQPRRIPLKRKKWFVYAKPPFAGPLLAQLRCSLPVLGSSESVHCRTDGELAELGGNPTRSIARSRRCASSSR